jgi:hypothetical protein
MDASWQAAFQRFRTVSAQLQALHKELQEAFQAHEHARLSALIARKNDLITEVQEIIADFQGSVAEGIHMMGTHIEAQKIPPPRATSLPPLSRAG